MARLKKKWAGDRPIVWTATRLYLDRRNLSILHSFFTLGRKASLRKAGKFTASLLKHGVGISSKLLESINTDAGRGEHDVDFNVRVQKGWFSVMALILWHDSMSVCIPEIDRHHRHLIELLNQLYEGFIERRSTQSIEILLQELVDYAVYHFAAEEQYMEADQYPHLAEHRLEHAQLTQRVREFQRDFWEGRQRIAVELLAFLSKWATAHIMEMDGAYGQFVQWQRLEG